MKYRIHYYKTKNISPNERNAMRRNQRGIWLDTGIITTDRSVGIREARREFMADKFRSVRA